MYKNVQNEIEILNTEISNNNEEIKVLNKKDEEFKHKDVKIKDLKLRYDDLKDKNEKILKLKDELNNTNEVLDKISERDKLNVEIETLNKKEEKIQNLKNVLQDYNKLNEDFNKLKDEKAKTLEIKKVSKERDIASKEFDVINQDYRKIEDEYKNQEDMFYREQAGILAENLKEGDKCPVCGSIHHPELAIKSKALSKEELDKLKLEKENKEKEKNKASDKVTVISTQIDTLVKALNYDLAKDSLDNYIKKISDEYDNKESRIKTKFEEANNLYKDIEEKDLSLDEFDFDEFKNSFNEKKSSVNQAIARSNAIIDSFSKNMKKDLSEKTNIKDYADDIKNKYEVASKETSELSNLISNLYYEIKEVVLVNVDEFEFDSFKEEYEETKKEHSKKLTECNTKKTEFLKTLEQKNKDLEKTKREYEEAYKSLGFENEEAYKLSIINEDALKSTVKEIEEYKNKCIQVNTQIEELRENLKDKEKIDVQKDKEELDNVNINLNTLKEEQQQLNTRYTTNKEMFDILNKDSKEIIKQVDSYMMLDDLYKTASGNLSGKRRIEFEQYVQAAYFDLIIIEANKRLLSMTSNRFKLVRKENSDKIREKIGLDLEVIDNYTGKRRDVKSLSGGESFKAALSLSLGVSDVIQSYSGGVVVDTLFIDEGFGSLDTESREQAIDTLNQLSDNNKLIGIISHVTELKERIDKKIIIEKTTSGSIVSIEA